MGKHYLIRHAESVANAGFATQDPALLGLTSKGKEQAHLLADALMSHDIRPRLIVVSPYKRTEETAGPLITLLPDIPWETWPIQEFDYLAGFRAQPSTYESRIHDRNTYWDVSDPDLVHSPGSESFRSFLDRVAATRKRLYATERVLIFGHHHFFTALLWLTCYPGQPVTHTTMQAYRLFASRHVMANASAVAIATETNAAEQLFTSTL
jgi:broad specificity phosphatase PhoE